MIGKAKELRPFFYRLLLPLSFCFLLFSAPQNVSAIDQGRVFGRRIPETNPWLEKAARLKPGMERAVVEQTLPIAGPAPISRQLHRSAGHDSNPDSHVIIYYLDNNWTVRIRYDLTGAIKESGELIEIDSPRNRLIEIEQFEIALLPLNTLKRKLGQVHVVEEHVVVPEDPPFSFQLSRDEIWEDLLQKYYYQLNIYPSGKSEPMQKLRWIEARAKSSTHPVFEVVDVDGDGNKDVRVFGGRAASGKIWHRSWLYEPDKAVFHLPMQTTN